MELTGKCKEDFELYLSQEYGKFETTTFQECASAPQYPIFLDEINLPESIENALIIEFFDSVGIHVNALKYNNIYFQPYCKKIMHEKYDSRQKALTEAIKKANEIYNSLA